MNRAIIDNCEKIVSDRIIVLKEKKNKSLYRAVNNQERNVSKYEVDGCIYKAGTNETRCDFLLETNQILYFIELKGSNIQKGLEQVLVSIKDLKQFFQYSLINARIITTRGTRPQRLNTYSEYRVLLRLIGKGSVIIRNTPFEESIN